MKIVKNGDRLKANRQTSALEKLMRHPERPYWEAALLMTNTLERWPFWPVQQALATIDSELQVNAAELIVRPPSDWSENEFGEFPEGLSRKKILHGLAPVEAAKLLNNILGSMHLFTGDGIMTTHVYSIFEKGAAINLSWKLIPLSLTPSPSRKRFPLGDHAHADLDATLADRGTLLDSVAGWAEDYAKVLRSARLFSKALNHPECLSQVT